VLVGAAVTGPEDEWLSVRSIEEGSRDIYGGGVHELPIAPAPCWLARRCRSKGRSGLPSADLRRVMSMQPPAIVR